MHLMKSSLLLALAATPLVAAVPAQGATAPITQQSFSLNRAQEGLPITVDLKLASTSPQVLDGLTVAVRDRAGRNLDFPLQSSYKTGTTYHQSRYLPRGTYQFFPAYFKDGQWTNLPARTVEVQAVPYKKVVFPPMEGVKEYPLTNQFAGPAWEAGHSSAYTGDSSGRVAQANPGDHKLDCISPAWSRPDADGTFRAVKNTARTTANDCSSDASRWKADFVTTRKNDLSGFKVKEGDTLTAKVTINKVQGSWPALWTWTDNGPMGPEAVGHGEVDLFEYHGDSWDNTLELTNWSTFKRPNYEWSHYAITPGKEFVLQVDFNTDANGGVKYWADGKLLASLPGVQPGWNGHLILSQSVDSGTSGHHKAPAAGTTTIKGFQVKDLSVWR